MKKLLFLAALVLLMAAFNAGAQTVGAATNIWGTNYFPVQISAGVSQTNQVYQAAAFKTVALGNITATNEGVFLYYVVNPTNGLTPAPGLPGWYIIGQVTNNFAGGTNGGSWSTTFNGTGSNVQCQVQLGIIILGAPGGSLYTNTAYVP